MITFLILLLSIAAVAFGTALGWAVRGQREEQIENKAWWNGFRTGRDSMPKYNDVR